MSGSDVLTVAVCIVGYALICRRVSAWWVTMPIVFVALGVATDALEIVELDIAIDEVAILAEVTLAVILFADAVRMNVNELRRGAELPLRLLLIGLPLTVAMSTVMTWWLLGTTFWAAALIAAVLAPTDAAVGEAVVADPSVPQRIRQALNVEAGLNDGLIVPAFVLFAELTLDETRSGSEWAEFVIRQVGGGLVAGVVAGGLGAYVLGLAMRAGWTEGVYSQVGTLALAVATFVAATELDVNAFIAAFVAGLAFGTILDDETADHLDEYTADSGALLAMVAFFVFGNLFVIDAFDSTRWQVLVCAALALTAGRMIPVAIATSFTGLQRPTVAFLGWFGPRGLASIVFGVLLLEEELPDADDLFGVITLTVLASIVLHGLSASPGAAAYGRWYARHEAIPMPESEPTIDRRLRR
ncbi:MAG: cation:proton antiporter [Ilumatobacter sp.]|uniref:cation:proton antiporter n=1 Tax=Ilumatobacter sp. TaxID=1967498 RepID=UPI00260FA417|nr:cation:proton antiporter [Ilumatobacter sp.]MDJ0767530.1 cation:proton antiporter [Ilumatobacter sp.]